MVPAPEFSVNSGKEVTCVCVAGGVGLVEGVYVCMHVYRTWVCGTVCRCIYICVSVGMTQC